MSLILSGTDGLSDVDGTAATPAIRGTDANTGIFFPAADTIAFSEGGVEAARFDSAGNLGIGTSSPASKLHVGVVGGGVIARFAHTGETNNPYAYFKTNEAGNIASLGSFSSGSNSALGFLTADTERMRIDSSGNLGIGTTTGSARFTANLDNSTAYANTAPNAANCTAAFTNGSAHTSGGTFVGYQLNISGNSQNRIGYFGAVSESASNQGLSLVFGTNTTAGDRSEKMRLDSSGNLLVGTTSTTVNPGVVVYGGISNAQIQIGHGNGVSSGEGYIGFQYNGSAIGSITQSGTTAVAYNTSSDYRLKNTIAPMTGALAKVALLKPCTYKWNADGSDGEGFIAHELAEVCPSAVTGEKDALDADGNIKPQGIDTSFLVATLTAAIQEQQALITQLTARITALETA